MITVSIIGGESYAVDYIPEMNGQEALQAAYNKAKLQGSEFTYSLQYYGTSLGYLVDMINETYDTFKSNYSPYYYWQFLLNGSPSNSGIDQTILNDGDIIECELTTNNTDFDVGTAIEVKHNSRIGK